MFVLHSKHAFSDALEGVASKFFRSLRSIIYILLSSKRAFSPCSLLNLQNLAEISAYSTAKLFGCFHSCIVSLQSGAVLEKIHGGWVSGIELPSKICELKCYKPKLLNLVSNCKCNVFQIDREALFKYESIDFSERHMGVWGLAPRKIFYTYLF